MAQIEKLTTRDEIVQFVHRVAPEYGSISARFGFTRVAHASFDSLVRTYHLQSFEKADLDGNGYTDLLFNGYLNKDGESRQYSIVVLSFGADSLRQQDISGAHGFFASRIVRVNGRDLVKISYLQAVDDSARKKGYHLTSKEDTLMAEDGRMVEVPPPVLHHIETFNVHDEGGTMVPPLQTA